MGGRNNTTPIGDGSIGIDTTDAVSREIQSQVSENNLKYQIGQNSSVKGVFNATVQMVNRWQRGDKYRILQEYGSIDSVSKNPTENELNQAVAVVLIAHLPKEELKRIVGSEESKQNKLMKTVGMNNAKALSLGKKYFNFGTARDLMQQNAGAINNPNKITKLLKKQDKNFSIDKKLTKGLPILKKELEEIIHSLSKQEIAQYAEEMSLPLEDNSSEKVVSNMIVSTVLMYVNLIIGKTKGISASRFSYQEIESIEHLLLMTSYAWVTGKATVGDLEISNRKKKAANAKKELEANKKMAAQTARHLKTKKISLFHKGEVTTKKVFAKRRSKNFIKEENKNAIKALDQKSDEEIRTLARTKNIPDAETADIDTLKKELTSYISSENLSIIELQEKAAKEKNPLKRKKLFDEIKTAKQGSLIGSINRAEQADQDYSDKIPVVTFNQEGKIASEGILKAVPVYIVGTAEKVGKIQSKKEAKKIQEQDNASAEAQTDKYFNELTNKLADNKKFFKLIKWKNKWKNRGQKNTKEIDEYIKENATNNDINDSNSEEKKSPTVKDILNGISNESAIWTPQSNNEENHYNKMSVLNPFATAASANEDDEINGTEQSKNSIKLKGKFYTISQVKDQVSDLSMDAFKDLKLNMDKKTLVTPVLDLNKSHDATIKMVDDFEIANRHLESIDTTVGMIPEMWATLQEVGTSMNTAAAGSALASISELVDGSLQALSYNITHNASSYDHNAIGGHMKGKNFVSSIVTGDHPQNKNNTEVVSVDWRNQDIRVKPVPTTTASIPTKSQKAQNSNITNKTQLSPKERTQPLSVGISSGLVHYTKTLNDAEDDGTKTAVKVYNVNSGVYDKIKIGDSEMSLFDAVYGIYTSFATLSDNIATSNQLLSAISSHTKNTNKQLSQLKNNSNPNGFTFTSELDNILSGN